MQGVLLSATRRSSGKTTIAMGLCRALKDRGMDVAPFKKGPDYIDPMWIGLAAGRACVNLDFNSMTEQEVAEKFAGHCQDQEIAVVEGTMGLFDGIDTSGSDSNAALAKQLNLPVILIVDCKGMARGIAPLLTGYLAFDPDIDLIGVVLNNVTGSRHEAKLRNAVKGYTDLPVIGVVPHQAELTINERHIGLMTSAEDHLAMHNIATIASTVAAGLDIDLLLDLAHRHRFDLAADCRKTEFPQAAGMRLGIARDQAFSFYYPDDIELMEKAGVEIHAFSPLEDRGLPEVDALFIGGGFPELYAGRLESNRSMREAVDRFCSSGRPVYAECGGLMYLARSLNWQGRRYRMAGYFPADIRMNDRPVGRGCVELSPTAQHLWHTGQSDRQQSSSVVRAHEFHHSSIDSLDENIDYAWQMVRGHGADGEHDGFVRQGVLAGFSHLRNTQGYPWILHFTRYIAQAHA